ncbi:SIR2 family protein [Bacteroides ihuae]|uniref:SIR2 family protein n=1 Tax=Bacteroides ihuae TaxID=1852362 RepID=UPI0008DB1E5C|nr:SIR2 family protein [Bacteroides ihuae]
MKIIDKNVFLRSFKVVPPNSFDLFLGSGASIAAGIPSGNELIWYFKREILNVEGKIDGKKIKDLRIEANKRLIQSFYNSNEEKKIENLYSHYFELCYPDPKIREDFLTCIIKDKKPSIGHSCISALIKGCRFHMVWTTNFDDLIEKAISSMDGLSCSVVSTKDANSASNFRNDIPKIVKLHGDFRYDKLQNTNSELQDLESSLHKHFVSNCQQKGLIVIGYSGSDISVLKSLRDTVNKENSFPKGLIWCLRKGEVPSSELISIVNDANNKNNCSGFIYIDTFDYFLYELYSISGIENNAIDSLAKIKFEQKTPFRLIQSSAKTPILLNAIKAVSYPTSFFVAKTSVSNWKELRELIENRNVVGALSKGNTYLLGEEGVVRDVFGKISSTSIEIQDVPERFYYINESFFLGLLYDLIEKSLINQHKLSLYKKSQNVRKIYDNNHQLSSTEINSIRDKYKQFQIPQGIVIYEAFEYKVEIINKELFFLLCPCVHIQNLNGTEPAKETAQYISNIIYSNRYNSIYGEKLKLWFGILKKSTDPIAFKLGNSEIKLSSYYSIASITQDNFHCFEKCSKVAEPFIYFHHQDSSKKSVHPINGLKMMGTLENSYNDLGNNMTKIKLGIISPDFGFECVKTHLNQLLLPSIPIWEKDYLKDYPGFDNIYKKQLVIPNSPQSEDVILISNRETADLNAIQFYEVIKKKIDKLAERFSELDCVIIYIPDKWKKFRENKTLDIYFDLHDSLKIYCVKKNLKVQFIEDKSINYKDKAKVLWWLSLGIYVKANGMPWRTESNEEGTAFVGLAYAIKQNAKNKVVLGSSQIFDGNGNGLKFLLQPIEKPVYYNKNPFMSTEDAFRLVSNIRNTYNRIDPTIGLNKIIIHKTTRFTKEEMEGINNALAGVDNIELLQIQQFCDWRALKLKQLATGKHGFDGYPIERGTIIQLDEYSFLLWTHGVVESMEFSRTYYQGKRGIPVPLLITRYMGKDPIENVASDILKFTKMNWNGAELYKTLPVTIDFSKKLSVMGKQIEDLGTKSYDFRYFI